MLCLIFLIQTVASIYAEHYVNSIPGQTEGPICSNNSVDCIFLFDNKGRFDRDIYDELGGSNYRAVVLTEVDEYCCSYARKNIGHLRMPVYFVKQLPVNTNWIHLEIGESEVYPSDNVYNGIIGLTISFSILYITLIICSAMDGLQHIWHPSEWKNCAVAPDKATYTAFAILSLLFRLVAIVVGPYWIRGFNAYGSTALVFSIATLSMGEEYYLSCHFQKVTSIQSDESASKWWKIMPVAILVVFILQLFLVFLPLVVVSFIPLFVIAIINVLLMFIASLISAILTRGKEQAVWSCWVAFWIATAYTIDFAHPFAMKSAVSLTIRMLLIGIVMPLVSLATLNMFRFTCAESSSD